MDSEKNVSFDFVDLANSKRFAYTKILYSFLAKLMVYNGVHVALVQDNSFRFPEKLVADGSIAKKDEKRPKKNDKRKREKKKSKRQKDTHQY